MPKTETIDQLRRRTEHKGPARRRQKSANRTGGQMLRVTIEMIPGGFSPMRKTIGSMRISNASNLAEVSDYNIDVMGGANPFTSSPPRSASCLVLAHDRAQSVWALLAKASQEIMKADFVEL
jgi:hypothetical protein